MIHHFSELKAKFSPEQRKRLDAEVDEMNREYVLSQLRSEVGLTQCEMAERLSISQPAYAAYEKAEAEGFEGTDDAGIAELNKVLQLTRLAFSD